MSAQAWYREPWPWILMSGPAAVLVAGAITTWIAFATADGLVADDYYKRGLAINKVLAREEAARARGVSMRVEMGSSKLKIQLAGDAPKVLLVHLAHATRAGYDRRLRLEPAGDATYEAALPPLPPGRWRVAVEDASGTWRIVKEGL